MISVETIDELEAHVLHALTESPVRASTAALRQDCRIQDVGRAEKGVLLDNDKREAIGLEQFKDFPLRNYV